MRTYAAAFILVIAAGAQTRRVVISPDQRTVRWSDSGAVLLYLRDLPSRSTVAPGFLLSNERFTHAALSPDGRWLAVSVRGNGQSWNGIVSVRTAAMVQLTLHRNDEAGRCFWSPDGRFLAVRTPAEVEVYNPRTGKRVGRKEVTGADDKGLRWDGNDRLIYKTAGDREETWAFSAAPAEKQR